MPKQRPDREDEDLVRLYLNDIGKHGLLTKDDEARLGQAIEQGVAAREELASGQPLTAARKRQLRQQVREAEEMTASIDDRDLRESVAKVIKAALARTPDGRPF